MDPDLERRAAMHAALGEPLRLAIAERLALGDAASSELSTAFDLPTNLLAHHLRVLEDAGLIRRVRSEGDRRRSYVQLVLDDPTVTGLVPPPAPSTAGGERVVFVCTQNSARSQLAAAAWAAVSTVPATSAGTHPAKRVHPRALRTARRHGLHLSERTADIADILQAGDLVVALCDNAHEELPAAAGRRLHWAVPDPAPADTDAAFETAYRQITQRVDRLASAVTALPHGAMRAPDQQARTTP